MNSYLEFLYSISFTFLLSEIMLLLLKRSANTDTKIKKDRLSLPLLWIAITFSITAGNFLAKHENFSKGTLIIAFIGLCITITGIIIRWVSIIQLKKEFTVDVAIVESHRLKNKWLIQHCSSSKLSWAYFNLLRTFNCNEQLVVFSFCKFPYNNSSSV